MTSQMALLDHSFSKKQSYQDRSYLNSPLDILVRPARAVAGARYLVDCCG
jgi:hypothetical protein